MTGDEPIEVVLRREAPHVLGAVVRRYGRFDLAEDAVQEALVAATTQWPVDGRPQRPRAWLISVAARRLIDQPRCDEARRRREDTDARLQAAPAPADGPSSGPGCDPDPESDGDRDDTLTLLFMCCHPALSPPSQLALTLRAIGGLTTAEIARAFLVPEATRAQRISRAKRTIAESGESFAQPPDAERTHRLDVVLHVLYLIFNEGYTASSGADLHRADLTSEAIRLSRMVRDRLPDDGEVAGLLALMLLTDARRSARSTADGRLVPLAEQDRSSWNRAAIDEGVELVATALAVAMVDGPPAGLAVLDELEADERMAHHHRMHAVRAHLLEMDGDLVAARASYQLAARRTTSSPEQRYLESRAADLANP